MSATNDINEERRLARLKRMPRGAATLYGSVTEVGSDVAAGIVQVSRGKRNAADQLPRLPAGDDVPGAPA